MNGLFNIVLLRLKLIYRNPAIKILMLVIAAIFFTLIGSLYKNIEHSVQIKIAYVDENQSEISRELIKNIHQNDFFLPIETTLEKGIQKLKKNEVEALFLINKDMEEQIKNGKLDGIVGFYYLSKNPLSPMVGDVFVGEMLQEISIQTAINYLEDVIVKQNNQEEILNKAYSYAKELAKNRKENYYIHIETHNQIDQSLLDGQSVDRKIIYKQMILGITLSFLCFFMLFAGTSIVKDYESGINRKIIISKVSIPIVILGEYISILLASNGIIFIFTIMSAAYSQSFVNTFISNYVILFLFATSFAAIIVAITKLFKNNASYIVIGSAFILVLGIISGCFFSIDLSLPIIKQIARLTPTYQGLKQLLYFATFGTFNEFGKYILYTCFIIAGLFILSIKHVQGRH